MARRSSIFQLPQDILDHVNDELARGSSSFETLAEDVNLRLLDKGHEMRVSKSALHRYAAVRQKLMQSNAVMQEMTRFMGSVPSGKQGRILMELVRSLAFETAGDLATTEDGVVSTAMLKDLALIIQRLEKADQMNAVREQEMRRAAMAEAAEKLEESIKGKGVSKETINSIKAELLGIKG